MAHWVRIHLLSAGGDRFSPWSLVQADAVKQLSPHATATEICVPRACALQQEQPSP